MYLYSNVLNSLLNQIDSLDLDDLDFQSESDPIEICFNSREYRPKQIFFCLRGEKFDAFDFVSKISCSIELVIAQNTKEREGLLADLKKQGKVKSWILVDNTEIFLRELSKKHLEHCREQNSNLIVAAISGSNGKTTTKEMFAHIASQELNREIPNRVIWTLKNDNNHIGVPFTLLRIHANQTDLAIIELGSNHPGEMAEICPLVKPDIALVTNIGLTHMEFFKDLDAVYSEETEVLNHLNEKSKLGIYLANLDDEIILENLKILHKTLGHKKLETETGFRLIGFSSAKNKLTDESSSDHLNLKYSLQGQPNSDSVSIDVCSTAQDNLNSSQNVLDNLLRGQSYRLENKFLIGSYNFVNLANAFILSGLCLKQINPSVEITNLCKHCQSFEPGLNRSQKLKWKGRDLFLDAYNANPSSMELSLKAFSDWVQSVNCSRDDTVVLIGDMNELGSIAPQEHRRLGELVSRLGFKNVLYKGQFFDDFSIGFKNSSLKDITSLEKDEVISLLQAGRMLFSKASRSLQLESYFAE